MGNEPKAVTCKTSGKVVYVYDERGNLIDTLSFQFNPIAQSFGSGISVICGTMCYTYTLKNGRLVQSGLHSV